MMDIQRCTKCLYPKSKPDMEFDENGVCIACQNVVKKNNIDWDAKKSELEKILSEYRGSGNWDCIIPVSGGKDSHYITYVLKKMEMNPLLVSFIPNDQTKLGRENLDNIKKVFDVDCIEFYAKPKQYLELQKTGLFELGDPAYPEHMGIFSTPFLIAKNFNINLLVWGENTVFEYGGVPQKKGQQEDGLFQSKLKLPNDPVYNTRKPDNITSIFLGDYVKWDAKKQVDIVKKHGFKTFGKPMEWTFLDYENLDTKFVALHDYFKWLKFGYGRATDQASIEIHHGRMTREQGLKLVKKYDGKLPTKHLKKFLKSMDISKEEFMKICDKFKTKVN